MHDPFLYPDFTSYIRQGEPSQRRRAENWAIAIGLQAVDGLRTSEYLHQVAKRNIEGEVEMGEVPHILRSHYQVQAQRESEYEQEEADKASANIAHLLSQPTLDFTVHGYLTVHRRIFEGVLKHAGRVRDYNITKEEWVLRGDTVSYLAHQDIMPALHYEIEQERSFDYAGLGLREVVAHLARFVASLWQVHAFCEGNTRTTAVFLIQHLRSIGFELSNALFAQHSWFFRNALVRANYKQVQLGISYEYAPLERFFQNLLMGEQHRLSNRQLLIAPPENWPRATEQVPNKYRTSRSCLPTACVAWCWHSERRL